MQHPTSLTHTCIGLQSAVEGLTRNSSAACSLAINIYIHVFSPFVLPVPTQSQHSDWSASDPDEEQTNQEAAYWNFFFGCSIFFPLLLLFIFCMQAVYKR